MRHTRPLLDGMSGATWVTLMHPPVGIRVGARVGARLGK